MKIQTQVRILVIGLIAVPVFVLTAQMAFRQFISSNVVSDLPAYDELSVMLQEHINVEHWDAISRNLFRFREFGDIAVFRYDFFVLYSEMPDFSPNTFASWESILPFFENQRTIFTAIGLEKNQGYILVNVKTQSIRDKMRPFFVHAFIGLIFGGLLTVFTICMSIIIARTIANSVRVLESATRRIAEGELDLEVEAKGSNEIISLTNSLNKMRNALKEEELRRSRFIMGITHDLKTPLALIKGYAEAIEDGVAEGPASCTEAAGIITAKADQLESMINDLIGYVHMETGELRTRLKRVNLTDFLRNSANTMKTDVELLQHTFIHEINLPENICIPLDEKLALRVLENLIHNAVRYTPNGSTIRFDAVLLKNSVELKVSDNGPGIDKEDLPHIFEMFYRGSSSRREQGMGLGLAVVKWVADYHGWSISASSDGGACFNISIPLP